MGCSAVQRTPVPIYSFKINLSGTWLRCRLNVALTTAGHEVKHKYQAHFREVSITHKPLAADVQRSLATGRHNAEGQGAVLLIAASNLTHAQFDANGCYSVQVGLPALHSFNANESAAAVCDLLKCSPCSICTYDSKTNHEFTCAQPENNQAT